MSRAGSVFGGAGTLGSVLANLGCCGAAALGPGVGLAAVSGTLAVVVGAWGYWLMYASLSLVVAGLGTSAWRRRSVGVLVLALGGVAALGLAFHESWDVEVFALLVWGGALALLAAVARDLVVSRRACRLGRAEG